MRFESEICHSISDALILYNEINDILDKYKTHILSFWIKLEKSNIVTKKGFTHGGAWIRGYTEHIFSSNVSREISCRGLLSKSFRSDRVRKEYLRSTPKYKGSVVKSFYFGDQMLIDMNEHKKKMIECIWKTRYLKDFNKKIKLVKADITFK